MRPDSKVRVWEEEGDSDNNDDSPVVAAACKAEPLDEGGDGEGEVEVEKEVRGEEAEEGRLSDLSFFVGVFAVVAGGAG